MSKPFSTRSLFFNGTDEYVTMGNVLGFERTNAFSISCWVKAVFTTDGYLVTKVSGDPFTGYALHFETAGTFRFFVSSALSTNAADVRTSSSGWDDERWHHVCATYDGSSAIAGIRIYVDGKSQTLSTIRNNLSASILSSASFNLAGRTDGSVLFNDNMGEVAVFDRELTAKEVRQLFNFGSPPDLSLLPFGDRVAGWWRMGNGDTLPTLTDHGYGGNNGTTVNMDSGNIKVDVPQARRHLVFDGTNEYVKMGDAAALSFERTAKFSISLWFSGAPASDGYMLSKITATPFTGYAILHGTSGWVRVYLFNAITTNGIQVTTSSTSWADSQWHHAVVTYDGSSSASGVRVYIDGASQALTTEQNNLSATIVNSAEFNLASRTNGSIPYAGKITQVSVWDVELSARDVAALYNLGDPPDALTVFNRRPVGYWPCDRLFLDNAGIFGSSAGVPDLSGNGNHGAPINMERGDIALGHPFTEMTDEVPVLPCSQLSCLFGGTDEYVTMGNVLGFERTDAFSVSLWFKTTDTNQDAIFAKMTGSGYTGYGLLTKSDGLYFEVISSYPSNWLQVKTTQAFNDGQWHHVVVTYDGSSTPAGVIFIIDGVQRTTSTVSNTLTSSILSAAEFRLGMRNTASFPSPYIGSLDEVSVFDKELSAEEAWVLYNKGAPCDLSEVSFASNLVGWWRMGDGDTFPTITDHSASGNDGTMTNMEAQDVVADVPTGKFSLLFGGTDEYVTMGNVLGFERNNPFSLVAWINTSSSSTMAVIAKLGDGTAYAGYQVFLQSGVFRFSIHHDNTASDDLLLTSDTVNDGTWHLLVVTYDGSSAASGVTFYVDGVTASKVVVRDTLSDSILTTNPLYIGGRATAGSLLPFVGNIADVGVYGVELTADEVLEVYNGGNPIDLRKMSSAANLAGYWPCGTGDLYPYIEDLSGNGYDGTMTNMEVTDIVNSSPFKRVLTGSPLLPLTSRYSVAFGGTNEYVTMGDVLGFERTNAFSVSCWVKANAGDTGYDMLIGKQLSSGTYRGWSLYLHRDANRLVFFLRSTINTNEASIYMDAAICDGTWHHVVFTYDGSSSANGMAFYTDGTLAKTTVIYNNLTATTINGAILSIGSMNAAGDWYVGSLDDVAVYNIELTAADISRIYNGGTPPDLSKFNTSANLVGWWKMGDGDTYPVLQDHGSGGVPYGLVRDLSGNSYNGTMVNMELTDISADVPDAYAATFDGVNEYITIPYTASLTFERTNPFSLSAWVRVSSAGSVNAFIFMHSVNGAGPGYWLSTYGDGTLWFELANVNGSNEIRATGPNMFDDTWHHVVATYDGSSLNTGLHLYVDGVDATVGQSGTLSATIVQNIPLGIGGSGNGGFASVQKDISDAAVWDKELSATEVAEIYNDTKPLDLTAVSAAANLVGWWRLGARFKTGSNNIPDFSGAGHPGTTANMESTDIVRRAYSGSPNSLVFDGGEYINCGNVLAFERTDSFSFSAWFKTTNTSVNMMLGKMGTSYQGYDFHLSGQTVRVEIINAFSGNWLQVYTTSNTWADGVWHHAVATYNGSSSASGVKIYVDGVQQSTTTGANTLSATIVNTAELHLGQRSGSSPYPFVGNLGNVAIYSKELTAGEVLEIYHQGIPNDLTLLASASNLVGYWRFGNSTPNPGTMVNMESSDIVRNDVPLAGGSLLLSQGGSDKDVSQVSIVTSGTAVTFKDVKGYGARAWQWSFVSYPATLRSAPTITNSEAREASITPVADGMYVVQLVRTDHDGRVSTDTQAFAVLDGEGHILPSAGIDGLINSSSAAALAGWFGRADASTNIIFDAYLRWLKAALKNAQAIPFVSGRQLKNATTFEGIGIVRLDSSDFPYTSAATFEVVLEVDSGYTAEVRLYNLTDSTTVAGSTLNTTNTAPTVLTGTLTMPSGQKTYEVQLRVTAGGGTATCTGARIILT